MMRVCEMCLPVKTFFRLSAGFCTAAYLARETFIIIHETVVFEQVLTAIVIQLSPSFRHWLHLA